MADDVTERDPLPVPAGLGERGSALWHAVTSQYALRVDELQLLADAAHECEIIERLQAELDRGSLITRGSMGQDAPHPVLVELRLHRGCLATLLTKLRLPDDGAAGPADAGAWSRSMHARRAANARWRPTAPR